MTVNLSPFSGVGAQLFDSNGDPLAGGKIYTYAAGTTTPQPTYTSSAGATALPNPIVLDAAGRVPTGEIWLYDGLSYKFVLKTSDDTTIATYDNVLGINSTLANFVTSQEIQTATASQTVFTLTTMQYSPGTNSLSVFVDGVNQYGPGASYDYTETDSTTVTFNTGLTVGAEVKFTTSVMVTDSGPASTQISYTPTYTGGIATNVGAKLDQYVSVIDFGADPTGVADSATAFSNAIATGRAVYIPKGAYNIDSPVTITNGVRLFGDGIAATTIRRNYSPSSDTDGIFNIRDGGTGIIMRDMTLVSLAGQSGGCLVSLINTGPSFGLFKFESMNFTTTGTSTHKYTFYADGTAVSVAPIGVRGLDFVACTLFGASDSTLYLLGVILFSFVGGGCFPAGGAANSRVFLSGTSAVETQNFIFMPANSGCPIELDYAKNGFVASANMGSVSNTANTSYIFGYGLSTSVQQNWTNSLFLTTGGPFTLSPAQTITNKTTLPVYPIDMNGAVTGSTKTSSVTEIGHVGAPFVTTTSTGQTFTFTTSLATMFTISNGGGAAALVFSDYKSSSVTIVSDPSNEFEASSTPSAGQTGIFKSANSNTISVKNGTAFTIDYYILSMGNVTATTDPV